MPLSFERFFGQNHIWLSSLRINSYAAIGITHMDFLTEHELQDAVIANAADIGYPDVGVIRNVRFSAESGRVDIMLLPAEGLHRIVLIEAKRHSAADAPDKVVGQLLKYYAHALTLGTRGVERYREYALANPNASQDNEKTTPHKVLGGLSGPEVWQQLAEGRQLQPQEIGLYLAFDGHPSSVLKQIITVLDVHHNLRIGAIQVAHDRARILTGAHFTKSLWPT